MELFYYRRRGRASGLHCKRRAAEEGKTLTRVIEEALRRHLEEPRRPKTPFRLKLVTKRGRLLGGVDLGS